jgi:hypothetical protein
MCDSWFLVPSSCEKQKDEPALDKPSPRTTINLLEMVLIGRASRMDFSSPAIKPGGWIPKRFSCDGHNISPPLCWSPGPEGTKSYAIVVDDPDALHVHTPFAAFMPSPSIMTHFAISNIPCTVSHLRENMRFASRFCRPEVLRNSHGGLGWTGMCPPRGTRRHRYRFMIYALDVPVLHGASSMLLTAEVFEQLFYYHILARGKFTAKFERP